VGVKKSRYVSMMHHKYVDVTIISQNNDGDVLAMFFNLHACDCFLNVDGLK